MKEMIFKNETKEEIFKIFENILIDDKYGLVKEAWMMESKNQMLFYGKEDILVAKVSFEGDYDWLTYLIYIQSICDYYDRNLGKTKFMVCFESNIP